jgi:hypothetical protein
MPKNTTKYSVLVNDTALEGTFAKKAKAIEAAETAAKGDKRANVRVETGTGTVVHEITGVKRIRMSAPYTRVVDLPEDAKIPAGMRVAYTRNRKGLAIVHDFNEPEGPYQVVNYVTGEVLATELPTTRDSGAFCKTVNA